jgi:hypothetical protein
VGCCTIRRSPTGGVVPSQLRKVAEDACGLGLVPHGRHNGASQRMGVSAERLLSSVSPPAPPPKCEHSALPPWPRPRSRVLRSCRFSIPASLNLSHFVARKIWLRCGVSPVHLRSNCLKRREPQQGLLMHREANFDLLQTRRLREARLLSPPRLRTGRESFPSSSSSVSKAV